MFLLPRPYVYFHFSRIFLIKNDSFSHNIPLFAVKNEAKVCLEKKGLTRSTYKVIFFGKKVDFSFSCLDTQKNIPKVPN